jgi:hypothetical protein
MLRPLLFLQVNEEESMDEKDPVAEKIAAKKHIRGLKAKRNDAITREASTEVKQVRRGIRTLKRRSRALARAVKAAKAAAVVTPTAS